MSRRRWRLRSTQPTVGSPPAGWLPSAITSRDVAMVAWAGHGVAVANAHPAVLEVADEVAASNDDDGVAIVLERLLG